jgi:uridine phosphorylase
MLKKKYPILEFDAERKAVFEPGAYVHPADVPERCVLCFFHDVIAGLVEKRQPRIAARPYSEMGPHPLYEFDLDGRRLAVFHPGVGAPLAAFLLEELIALGCKKFVAYGGAGVLDESLPVGHVIVPSAAVRDEGTSYHYLPPGREVSASPEGLAAIEAVLKKHGREYVVAKTWTNDGFYRETPAKVQLRRSEGCVAVEMEAAAFFAVAQFRGVSFAQMLYAGDDVSGAEWDSRDWEKQYPIREGLFWLAAEACLSL